jgi:hypothetical protein
MDSWGVSGTTNYVWLVWHMLWSLAYGIGGYGLLYTYISGEKKGKGVFRVSIFTHVGIDTCYSSLKPLPRRVPVLFW